MLEIILFRFLTKKEIAITKVSKNIILLNCINYLDFF
jgi:hypothetical protein